MITPIQVAAGSLLTNALATYYTVPATNKQTLITNVCFLNTDSVPRTVDLHIIPSGGTASSANARFKTLSIQQAAGGDPPPFFTIGVVMAPGDFIQAKADTGAVVAFSANGMSYT